MANTTISVSQELLKQLKARKLYDKESYEEVIWDALEDSTEVSEQTKAEILKARAEYKAGNFVTLAEAKKKYGGK